LGEVVVAPQGRGELLACYVPNLEQDIIAPLRRAGHSGEVIAGLGEVF